MTAVGIYCRISSDRDGDGMGVARQRVDCEALAQARGWSVHDVYTDNDISAYSGKARPEYRRLLDDVKAGQVDTILCWHPDRLHRSPRELEDFIDLLEASGANVVSATAGDRDFATPEGKVMARIEGAIARKESEDKSRRLRRKHLELAQGGRPAGGGTRPFGYTRDRAGIIEAEAAFVREAAQRVLAGDTVRSIARDWNTRSVATVTGAAWTMSVIRRMLAGGMHAGFRDHPSTGLVKGTWPPILDEVTFRRVRAVLLDPARRTVTQPRSYLLTGRLTCSLCGARCVARPRADKARAYVCATGPGFYGCGKLRCLAEPLEDWVARLVFERVDSGRVRRSVERARGVLDEQAAVDAAAVDEAALEALARDHYVDRVISRAEFLAARGPLEARLADSRRRLARRAGFEAVAPFTARKGTLAAAWDELPVERRRAIVAQLVEAVVLGPAVRGRNYFDPDRVEVRWAL